MRWLWLSRALGKAAAQGEHHRHGVLGHRAGIDAAGNWQPDAEPCQFLARELVGTSADRLNEAEPFRVVEKLVLP